MSYQVSVMGYGFSKEMEAEGPLSTALSELDAKFSSFDLGSFLYEMSGMKYQEVNGGFYSWMIYKTGNDGIPQFVNEGLNKLIPKQGEHIYLMYQFFPSGSYQERELLRLPKPPKLPERPQPPEYQFVLPEKYELPDLFEYGESTVEEELLTASVFEEEDKQELNVPLYSKPEFTLPLPASIETYQLVRPLPEPARTPLPEFQDDDGLERFLMDVMSEAKFTSLLAGITQKEDAIASLVQV